MTRCLEEEQFCRLPQSAFLKCVFWDINSTRSPVNSLGNHVWEMMHIIPWLEIQNTQPCTKTSDNSRSKQKAFN